MAIKTGQKLVRALPMWETLLVLNGVIGSTRRLPEKPGDGGYFSSFSLEQTWSAVAGKAHLISRLPRDPR